MERSLPELGVVEAAVRIAGGDLRAADLVDALLTRVEDEDAGLRAFVTVCADAARGEARTLDAEAAAGRLRGPLHGVPVAIKDLVDVAGVATTCSSRVRARAVASEDATVVRRLREAGAIVLGKTNTHEFAYGPISAPTRNPRDRERIPGGSSGGSAAAVAAGMAPAALGSDTGGSIRIPAAFCGVVGLKPTYGRVPKSGVVPLSWSLDHVGPLTRSVADAAALLSVLAGRDRADPTSAREPVDDYARELEAGVDGLRLGVPRNYFREVIDPAVLALVDGAATELERLGATLVEVSVPDVELTVPVEMAILLPEASSYHQEELRLHADLYGDDVRRFLELGELYLATHHVNGQRGRTLVKEGMRGAFEKAELDALLVPAAPMTAPPVGQYEIDLGGERTSVIGALFRGCAPFNLTGQPLLSVPCGCAPDGLPVGVGIAGRPFDEATVLRIGRAYERATAGPRAAAAGAATG